MRTLILILVVIFAYVYHQQALFDAEQRAIEAAADAYKQGKKDALSLKEPISDDLEFACVALWMGIQHKKHQ